MRFLLLALVSAAALLALIEARRIDQDFEFDDEATQVGTGGATHVRRPRRYIYDPHNPLCRALSCRRRLVCMLRALPHSAPRAALCANKKELLRRGDTVVAATPDAEVLSDDEVFYDDGARDDVIPRDATPSDRCVGCGRTQHGASHFLCGTDNRTYSSVCRLELHNCVRRPTPPVTRACRGFCPCRAPDYEYEDNRVDTPTDNSGAEPPLPKSNRWRDVENEQNEVIDRPERRQARRRLTTGVASSASNAGCALDRLADRLLDWFSVLMDDAAGTPPSRVGFPRECKPEVRWMFTHLDSDSDGLLSQRELYALRHDDREKCLRPFLASCGGSSGVSGVSRSSGISGLSGIGRGAWCDCLRRAARPCTALARAHPNPSPGAYVPSCDSLGFYSPRQCHPALGVCWCVTAHGVEVRGSRTKGAPSCGGETTSNGLDEEELLLSGEGAPDDDEDAPGSGGGPPPNTIHNQY